MLITQSPLHRSGEAGLLANLRAGQASLTRPEGRLLALLDLLGEATLHDVYYLALETPPSVAPAPRVVKPLQNSVIHSLPSGNCRPLHLLLSSCMGRSATQHFTT